MKLVVTVDAILENGRCQEILFTCNVNTIFDSGLTERYSEIFFYLAFTMEQDIPDYDIDSEDEKWIHSQAGKFEIAPLQVVNVLRIIV